MSRAGDSDLVILLIVRKRWVSVFVADATALPTHFPRNRSLQQLVQDQIVIGSSQRPPFVTCIQEYNRRRRSCST